MINYLFKKGKKGSFKSNFFWTFSSKAYLFSLTLIFTPVLARLYTTEEYGYMSFLTLVTTHFVLLSGLTFPDAIMVAKTTSDLRRLTNLSSSLVGVMSFALLIVGPFVLNLHFELPFYIALIICLFAILSAFINIANKWSQFYNEFRFASVQNSIGMTVARLTAVSFAFLSIAKIGLVLGEGIGRLFSISAFNFHYKGLWSKSLVKSFRGTRKTFRKFRQYPIYILPSRYLALLINQATLLLVASQYDISKLGEVSMAFSLLAIPTNLIGNSLAPVLLRRLRDSELPEKKVIIKKVTMLLVLVTTTCIIGFIFLGEPLFIFILGNQWTFAASVAIIIVISLSQDLISIVLSGLYQLERIERALFRINLSFGVILAFIGGLILTEIGNSDILMIILVLTLFKGLYSSMKINIILSYYRLWTTCIINIITFFLVIVMLLIQIL